jgi:hypothetical protein
MTRNLSLAPPCYAFRKIVKIVKYTRWLISLRVKSFFVRSDNWVLSRTACLGNDSFAIFSEEYNLRRFNMQKSRLDLLIESPKLKKDFFSFSDLIEREDILPLIWAQPKNYWQEFPKPKFILFDSFSDLTDNKFVHKETGAHFFCHKSDLALNLHDKQVLKVEGLLDLADVKYRYTDLFQHFRQKWGDVKIIFVHYPIKLESRSLYIMRAKLIVNAIEELEKTNSGLYSIKVPENLVAAQTLPSGKLSSFPYHYSAETYIWIANRMSQILKKC